MTEHVLVMAKSPVAGRVKTRLCPPCSPEEAAEVAAAALGDTLEAVAACGAARKIVALDGRPGPWLPAGFELIPQRGGDLAERLGLAWADAGGPGIQIGMDTPQVRAGELDGLLASLLESPRGEPAGGPHRELGGGSRPGLTGRRRPAVLGHAADGGWWVIGFDGVGPSSVFRGIPMSTASTGRHQERRLRRLGMEVVLAGVHRDIDTADDLADVAALMPGSRTESAAAALGLVRQVA
jgi:glycosyltransferase A (GT-A) superfamily protein (DUF2064 family)